MYGPGELYTAPHNVELAWQSEEGWARNELATRISASHCFTSATEIQAQTDGEGTNVNIALHFTVAVDVLVVADSDNTRGPNKLKQFSLVQRSCPFGHDWKYTAWSTAAVT